MRAKYRAWQELELQACVQPLHRTLNGNLQLSSWPQETRRGRQFRNVQTGDVASDGPATERGGDCMGTVPGEVKRCCSADVLMCRPTMIKYKYDNIRDLVGPKVATMLVLWIILRLISS